MDNKVGKTIVGGEAAGKRLDHWLISTFPYHSRNEWQKNILMLAKSYGERQDNDEIRIGLQLAQEDLAQLVGASRQRVNQELKGLEREGAIRVEPTRLVVLSREKLMQVAER